MELDKIGMMKKIITLSFLIIGVLFLMTSCEPDTDFDPTLNPVDELVGEWTVNENSNLYHSSVYRVIIEKDSSRENSIFMYNLYHVGVDESTNASVLGNTELMIAKQSICENTASLYIEGEGVITSNYRTIELEYLVNDGADIDTVSAVLTKL